KGTSTIDLGYALHAAITSYRQAPPEPHRPPSEPHRPPPEHTPTRRGKPGVSPLDNYVAVAELYFDELLRIVLPMSNWWHDKNLSAVRNKAARSGRALDEMLEQAIRNK